MISKPVSTSRSRFGQSVALTLGVLMLLAFSWSGAAAQQFNSDNWWVLPHATGMGVATFGEHYNSMYLGYGFLPGWEADISTTIYEKEDLNSGNHYSTSAYVKRLIVENEAQTSGISVMAGIGSTPGYLQSGAVTRDFKSYWAYAPITVPFFDNMVSWDIMPGISFNQEYGSAEEETWGFPYSTRVAVYKIIPQSALVGEIFGSEGDAFSEPQYKAGVRWESKYLVVALTYGGALDGGDGGGVELGFMALTPPFL